jgi:predicted transcriptional regulator
MKEKIMGDRELASCIKRGMKHADIARHFGVTRAAVTKRIQRERDLAEMMMRSSPAAQVIFDQKIDLAMEMESLMRSSKKVLDQLNNVIDGTEPPESIEHLLASKTSPLEGLIKVQQELRKLYMFGYNVLRDIHSMKEVRKFQEIVIEELKKESPETARRVLDRFMLQTKKVAEPFTLDDEDDIIDV